MAIERIEVLELWKQTYPRDFVPRTNLSARYGAIGRYQEALEEAREGLRLNPDAGVAYAAVAHTLICLGQLGEAGATIEQALARKLDPPYSHYMLYAIALLQGRCAGRAAADRPRLGNPGRGGDAGDAVGHRGVRRPGAPGAGADETGDGTGEGQRPRRGRRRVRGWKCACGRRPTAIAARRSSPSTRALALSRGRHALSWSALAVAMCGDSSRAGEARRRDGPPIPRELVFQVVLAADGAGRGLASIAAMRPPPWTN